MFNLPGSPCTVVRPRVTRHKVDRAITARRARNFSSSTSRRSRTAFMQDRRDPDHRRWSTAPRRARRPSARRARRGRRVPEDHRSPVLRFAQAIKGEISHSVLDFDRVMLGLWLAARPCRLMDAIGHEHLGDTPRYYEGGTFLGHDNVYTRPDPGRSTRQSRTSTMWPATLHAPGVGRRCYCPLPPQARWASSALQSWTS